MKTVLVFGTFDRLHPGHESFLKQARKQGDKLIICLARDTVVRELKQKTPSQNEQERQKALEKSNLVDKVILGDAKLGTYSCLSEANPDVVAIGYDQEALKESIQKWITKKRLPIKLVTLQPHKPHIYKTSILDV